MARARRGSHFLIVRLLPAILFVVALFATLPSSPASPSARGPAARVIVQAQSPARAAQLVRAAGGRVSRTLSIVSGVAATVPASRLAALAATPGVRVSPDAPVTFSGAWNDPGTPKRIQKIIRSDDLWDEGVTGEGVNVALIDTGVYAAHPDLQGPSGSRVVHCEDFTHEGGTEAECADTFGHGTFMAGLIAGNGTSSNGRYMGSAPEAGIVSIKVAGFDGATDMSTLLAGMQWAVAFKDVYGIRVMSLSLGSDSGQDYRLSPLNFAVERAWSSGVVVVVSAGNSGPGGRTVTKPGDDPYVITVGADDDQGTIPIHDDAVPVFSARGPTKSNGLTKPDLLAPGVHTVSLRSPGSAIDQRYGSYAAVGSQYFRGTGTSMSTATVSGVVAQILQREPGLNPNQVKYRLAQTARAIASTDLNIAGRGLIDAHAASHLDSTAEANQGLTPSSGLGLLQLDRGSVKVEVVTPIGEINLLGEYSAQVDLDEISLSNPAGLVPFVSLTYTMVGWDPASWEFTSWSTEDWTGMTWKGMTWKATVWDGMTWKGMTWKNTDWDGMTWKDADWEGMTWKASSWQTAWYAVAWD